MPTPDAPNPAPVGNEKRQAHDKLKGYQYQIWYAVLCWINLESDQDIYIETAEDVDLVSSAEIQAGQLKHTATSLSLNTAAATKALGDFWELRNLNPRRRVLFNYITTGNTAKEENATFTGDRAGLDVWESAKTNDADAEAIRAFLRKKATDSLLPADLAALLKDGPIEQVLDKLIRPITWQTGAPSYPAAPREKKFVASSRFGKMLVAGRAGAGLPLKEASIPPSFRTISTETEFRVSFTSKRLRLKIPGNIVPPSVLLNHEFVSRRGM